MFSTFFLLFIIWGVYRRIKITVGIRPYKPLKIQIRLFVLVAAMGLFVLIHPLEKSSILYGGLGVMAGVLFVYMMGKDLRFTREGEKLYYQINPYLSLFISGLILARIIMKLPAILYLTAWLDGSNKTPLDLSYVYSMVDPVSFFIIMMMFAYFVGSSCWIFFQGRRFSSE